MKMTHPTSNYVLPPYTLSIITQVRYLYDVVVLRLTGPSSALGSFISVCRASGTNRTLPPKHPSPVSELQVCSPSLDLKLRCRYSVWHLNNCPAVYAYLYLHEVTSSDLLAWEQYLNRWGLSHRLSKVEFTARRDKLARMAIHALGDLAFFPSASLLDHFGFVTVDWARYDAALQRAYTRLAEPSPYLASFVATVLATRDHTMRRGLMPAVMFLRSLKRPLPRLGPRFWDHTPFHHWLAETLARLDTGRLRKLGAEGVPVLPLPVPDATPESATSSSSGNVPGVQPCLGATQRCGGD